MSDLINREEAKDALAKFVPYVIDDISTESYTNGLKDAYDLICQLPSVQMDNEQKRIETICSIANINNIEDLSDGYHTFKQLYYQRMMLFAAIVKQNKDKAWKSLRHEDGELCFGGGWFIVGVETPEGSYTYHYEDIYYSLFDCEELPKGKHWDGHTEKDVTRLLSLSSPAKWICG